MKKVFLCLISVFVLASLCVAMAVPAMAATYSAEGEEVFQINVSSFAEGSKSSGNYKVEDDGTITLTVSKDSDYIFVKWAIDGEYEIVSGSLTSKTLVIRPLSDLDVEEAYDVKGSQGAGEKPAEWVENESGKAPETGNAALSFAVLLTACGFATVLFAKKRLAA